MGKVLISAGIHGDEPSGVRAVLYLLETRPSWLRSFDLTVFPCINPWGYERNTRRNELKHDVNRQWRVSSCGDEWTQAETSEVIMCQRVLKGKTYDLCVCLHEDYDGTGFYLYELSGEDQNNYGESIVRAVSRRILIEKRKSVENRHCHHGVIHRSPESLRQRKFWPEALYHIVHHCKHTITTETPTSFPIEKRIRAHCESLRVALKLLAQNIF